MTLSQEISKIPAQNTKNHIVMGAANSVVGVSVCKSMSFAFKARCISCALILYASEISIRESKRCIFTVSRGLSLFEWELFCTVGVVGEKDAWSCGVI